MTVDPSEREGEIAARLAQIRTRNEALRHLHGPGPTGRPRPDSARRIGGYCICGRRLEKCGTWTDMQTASFLLAEVGRLREAVALIAGYDKNVTDDDGREIPGRRAVHPAICHIAANALAPSPIEGES